MTTRAPFAAATTTARRRRAAGLPCPRPRLLWLDLRRNPDLWILIGAGAICVWMAHLTTFSAPIVYWTDASVFARTAVFVLGPVSAGVAARAAARDRWAGLDELVGTVARPEQTRRLTAWAAVAIAAVGVHLLVVAYVIARTATEVVWDGPYYATMLAGPSAVVATSALGYAAGAAWTNRFVAALVTIAAFLLVLQGANVADAGWRSLLSPLHRLETSPWTGITPDLGPLPALFSLALAGVFLGTLSLRRAHRQFPILLVVSAALAAACAAAVAARVPEEPVSSVVARYDGDPGDPNAPAAGTYEPVCGDGPIPVCLHPAHAPLLGTASGQINRALAPLVGLGGTDAVPSRVDLLPRPDPTPPPGVVSRSIGDDPPSFALWSAVVDIAGVAVGIAPVTEGGTTRSAPTPAQSVVRAHLLTQSGISVRCADDRLEATGPNWGSSGFGGPVSCDALDRFAALPPDEQRAWLGNHLAALRAGRLRLEDLP